MMNDTLMVIFNYLNSKQWSDVKGCMAQFWFNEIIIQLARNKIYQAIFR